MNSVVSLSIIDLMGEINGGIGILFSLKVKDRVYELIYWFDNKDNFRLVVDQDFLKDFDLKDIYDYDNLPYLVGFIEKNISDKIGLLEQFGIK